MRCAGRDCGLDLIDPVAFHYDVRDASLRGTIGRFGYAPGNGDVIILDHRPIPAGQRDLVPEVVQQDHRL